MNLAELLQELRRDELPSLVEFWAPWCGPCRAMAPTLDQLAREYEGRVRLVKINADEQPDLLRELNVMAIPTMLVVSGGKVVQRRTGVQSRPVLAGLFASLAKAGSDPSSLIAPTMDPVTRILRLVSGLVLVGMGIWFNTWIVIIAGGLVAFWGWYDRCPVWQALTARFGPMFKKRGQPPEASKSTRAP